MNKRERELDAVLDEPASHHDAAHPSPATPRPPQGPSRGPNTAPGKAASSRNAFKHGLRSDQPIIPGESLKEWNFHLQGIMDSIQPVGYLEEFMAGRFATLLWQSQRVILFEVGAITKNIELAAQGAQIAQAYAAGTLSKGILPEVSEEQIARQAWGHILPSDENIDKIMRYGGSIHRQALQIYHEIEAMQARRMGQNTPLARVDFSGPPLG